MKKRDWGILRESPAFLDILEEGRDIAIARGIEMGIELGKLQTARKHFLLVLEMRFPRLKNLARKRANFINESEILRKLMIKAVKVKTSSAMRHYLLTWRKGNL